MRNIAELKALIALLAPEPRLAIVEAVCRRPGSTAAEVAQALSLAEYETAPGLAALHEGGVLMLEDERWYLSPRIRARIEGEFMNFRAVTRDGCMLRLHAPRQVRADDFWL